MTIPSHYKQKVIEMWLTPAMVIYPQIKTKSNQNKIISRCISPRETGLSFPTNQKAKTVLCGPGGHVLAKYA